MLVLAMHLLQNIAELMGSFRATERQNVELTGQNREC